MKNVLIHRYFCHFFFTRPWFGLLAVMLAPSVQAAAQLNGLSDSYLAIGSEFISFKEQTRILGSPLNMETTTVGVMQRSGGYTALNRHFGFYIHTASTLLGLDKRESWNVAPYGTIQNNLRKINWNELLLLPAWNSGLHTQLLLGMGLRTLGFTRWDFRADSGTAAFNRKVAPQKLSLLSGAVTEDFLNVNAMFGMRYQNHSHKEVSARHNYRLETYLSMPVYYQVTNSAFPNVTWREYFHGYDWEASAGYRYRAYRNFYLQAGLDIIYQSRPQTGSRAVSGGRTGVIPETTAWNLRSYLGIGWRY